MHKQIIAMGGGGFSMEPENLLLDKYVLQQTNQSSPKVCFVPTASGDAQSYIERFYHSFESLDCEPSHLSLFKPPTADLEDYVLSKDVIYVGGGNTRNLIVLWKEWGLDHIFRKAWESGIVLAGLSAGSICWFEQGVTDSIPGELTALSCLGFLKGSNCPHYDGELERRPAYHNLIRKKKILPGLAADDGVAFHFINEEIHKIVSSRKEASAYNVYLNGSNQIVEEQFKPQYLGE
jgi:dipeptidase E